MHAPVVVAQPSDAYVEQRPLIGGQHLVRHRLPGLGRRSLADRARRAGQIGIGDHEGRHGWQDALGPVRCDHRTQHRMTVDRAAPCDGEARQVELPNDEFGVDVAGNLAERHELLAAEPVGLLDRRQWKGLEGAVRIDLQPRGA
ncbi:hypothetical protein R70199_08176 [Paraburkholderia domus]|nr:hypothetical protein R70199_08176 [Paraburkholderia domus]